MRVLLVHNEYGRRSGEEVVVDSLAEGLHEAGVAVCRFTRSSATVRGSLSGQATAFLTGIYNPFARRSFRNTLREVQPDVVHIHNLFPLISPAILLDCKQHGLPVVMTVHNFRLICPNGLMLRRGKLCNKCLNGKEYYCVVVNCEENVFRSVGYAARSYFARTARLFLDGVQRYICLSRFQKSLLVGQGFSDSACVVIPNAIGEEHVAVGRARCDPNADVRAHPKYAVWIGRLSPEKAPDVLLRAAALVPEVTFVVAGPLDRMPGLARSASPNVKFVGQLTPSEIIELLRGASLLAFTTRYYEGMPMVLLESMACGVPVAAPRIGGIPELLEHERSGLLYEADSAQALAQAVRRLSSESELAQSVSRQALLRAESVHNRRSIVLQTVQVYESVLQD